MHTREKKKASSKRLHLIVVCLCSVLACHRMFSAAPQKKACIGDEEYRTVEPRAAAPASEAYAVCPCDNDGDRQRCHFVDGSRSTPKKILLRTRQSSPSGLGDQGTKNNRRKELSFLPLYHTIPCRQAACQNRHSEDRELHPAQGHHPGESGQGEAVLSFPAGQLPAPAYLPLPPGEDACCRFPQ